MKTVRAFLIERNRLVEENLDLVRQIAKFVMKSLPPCFELDDLVQAGNIGLMDAATKYDPSRGVPFRVYASQRVRGEIKESCRRKRYRDNTHEELTQEHAESAEDTRLASLDAGVKAKQLRRRIAQALDGMPNADRQVIEIYFLRGGKLAGVGKAFGVRQSRSSQLLQRAKSEMRRALEMRGINATAA